MGLDSVRIGDVLSHGVCLKYRSENVDKIQRTAVFHEREKEQTQQAT